MFFEKIFVVYVYILNPLILCLCALPSSNPYAKMFTIPGILLNSLYYEWLYFRDMYGDFNENIFAACHSFSRSAGCVMLLDKILYAETKRERYSGMSIPYDQEYINSISYFYLYNSLRTRCFKDVSKYVSRHTGNVYSDNFGGLMLAHGRVSTCTLKSENEEDYISAVMEI